MSDDFFCLLFGICRKFEICDQIRVFMSKVMLRDWLANLFWKIDPNRARIRCARSKLMKCASSQKCLYNNAVDFNVLPFSNKLTVSSKFKEDLSSEDHPQVYWKIKQHKKTLKNKVNAICNVNAIFFI